MTKKVKENTNTEKGGSSKSTFKKIVNKSTVAGWAVGLIIGLVAGLILGSVIV